MKYKDTKPDDNYRCDFYWYITDEPSHEFARCDNCGIEVPLASFPDLSSSKWLCRLCANTTIRQDERSTAQAANMILLTLGAFDDIEVLLAREHIPDYYE